MPDKPIDIQPRDVISADVSDDDLQWYEALRDAARRYQALPESTKKAIRIAMEETRKELDEYIQY